MAAAMSPKRIYIGGLTADVSQSDVSGRFKPFGHVLSTEIIKSKAVGSDPNSCRGFAYVTLEPKDEASLARMLSLVSRRPLVGLLLLQLVPPLLRPTAAQMD